VSWLSLNGIDPINIESNPISGQSTFFYDKNVDVIQLQSLINAYTGGIAIGNIILYHRIYRKFLKAIKEGRL
jgi:hypothetical protein